MLGELEERTGRVVLADFEAGIGSVLRSEAGQIDVLVVVVEPYLRSLDVGRRLLEMAPDRGVERIIVVANKVRDEDDLEVMRTKLGAEVDFIVPSDEAVEEADLYGEAVVDRSPDAPAVVAIRTVAERIRAMGDEAAAG